MKYAVFAFMLCLASLWAVVKFHQATMTPEQRAVEEKQFQLEQEKKLAAVWAEDDRQRKQNERVREAGAVFVGDLLKIEGIESASINETGEVVKVRFAPEAHISPDHIRVLCEEIASRWAVRAGLDYARCEDWFGSKLYAEGKFFRK